MHCKEYSPDGFTPFPADKLRSDQGEHARALWTAKGKQAFDAERKEEMPTIAQDRAGHHP